MRDFFNARRFVKATAAVLLFVGAGRADAQRLDSARVSPKRPPVDTTNALPKPPLSPSRAFLYSLIIPGYSQSRLGRPTAGAIFILTESIAIAMLRESSYELREAQRFRTDSLVLIGNDPITGQPVFQRAGYTDQLIDVRRGHVEDWIAFLIANHLFAGADAYVAAHLWDLPTQIEVKPARGGAGGTNIGARIRF